MFYGSELVFPGNSDWNQLAIEHEIANLRGDLATSSPQSYSLEERRHISEEMDASTKAIDAAMRADFRSMPAEARSRMHDWPELNEKTKKTIRRRIETSWIHLD